MLMYILLSLGPLNTRSFEGPQTTFHECTALVKDPFLLLATSTMADPTKAEIEQIFKVLRAQKGNKVSRIVYRRSHQLTTSRSALTAKLGILRGQV